MKSMQKICTINNSTGIYRKKFVEASKFGDLEGCVDSFAALFDICANYS